MRRTLETLTSTDASTNCACNTHATNDPACCDQEFKQGELLVRQGEKADSMYAIKVRRIMAQEAPACLTAAQRP